MYQIYVDLLSTRYQRETCQFQEQGLAKDGKNFHHPDWALFIRKFGGSLVHLGFALEEFGLSRQTHPLSGRNQVYLKEETR